MACDSNDYTNENCSGGQSDDYDVCEDCCEPVEDCICWDKNICEECGEPGKEFLECGCYPNISDREDDTDEFDDENVIDTFRPMNAFARARWLKAQRKI